MSVACKGVLSQKTSMPPADDTAPDAIVPRVPAQPSQAAPDKVEPHAIDLYFG
eukprot:CAMPEP_0115828508 /NCGR_PEP_ID=MMETSP0287-20121206/608_1 /TAXON_ID=412157 /ORGANISM="Chrysochromulina rotalis, Strain UIO044" /LENGTH=52 /DNA_ID=CAMNT_0003281723 /DNA_START=590 /DNA_END=745 /DNA_ORIENTATION=-